MAERGNTTHGPKLDDQLKHETQGLIQGNHPTRAEEWRETETVDDGEDSPDTGDRPVYDSGTDPAQVTDAADDGALTEPIADTAGNDEEAQ